MTDPIYTHRTRDGHRARIICTDVKDNVYPVVAAIEYDAGETIMRYTKTLQYDIYGESGESDLDLFEYSPWSDVAVDTPIWVANTAGIWCPRHFAKYEDGKVFAWVNGRTSHTETEMFECDDAVTLQLTKQQN